MSCIFTDKCFQAINEYGMLDGVSTVTVAFSGGADSMSLLHFLTKHSSELGITVEAAHLNHCLRGDDANRDEQFAADQCEKYGVELHIRRVDIAALSKDRKIGHEQCGRDERYRFFSELRHDGYATATAHTASDNAETVLLNITRGCGLDGLCGIPPVRGGIIRPLIYCTRAEVEEYCRRESIPYVTDATNLTDEYSRNKIRLNVMPVMKQINPSAENTINRLSSLCRSDLDLINSLAYDELQRCRTAEGLAVDKLRQCGSHLISHIIKKFIDETLDIIPEKRHLDLITKIIYEGHGAVEIRGGKYIKIENGILKSSIKTEDPVSAEPQEWKFSEGMQLGHLVISDKKRTNETDFGFNHKINKKLLINCLSCGIITSETIIRTRRSGDVFSQYGRHKKTLKKLFTEMKLPPEERSRRLVIANGSEVLWVEGIGVSREAAVTENDEYYYEVRTVCE